MEPVIENIVAESYNPAESDADNAVAHGQQHPLVKWKHLRRNSIATSTLADSQSLPLMPLYRRRQSFDVLGSCPPLLAIKLHYEQFATDPKHVQLSFKEQLLAQEDTDQDSQITILDEGPKALLVSSTTTAYQPSFSSKKVLIADTYALSNLLQEIQLAEDSMRDFVVISPSKLYENPLERLQRRIKFHFWNSLTRRIDAQGLEKIFLDPKNRQGNETRNCIYVPAADSNALMYYKNLSRKNGYLNLDVISLPRIISPQYAQSLDSASGILALALKRLDASVGWNVIENIVGAPFVVPGGRFNEQYGWDSYFETLGLIQDDRVDLAEGMIDNFVYEIDYYGKILNANRSYYLMRSQPPFLTDMVRQTYNALIKSQSCDKIRLKLWLSRATRACIKELLSVWLTAPRLDTVTGLSKYHPIGIGIPPETEPGHFDAILKPFAEKLGMSLSEYEKSYNIGKISEPKLDEYFKHDRAVRESGHDTTYRFDGRCADLATVDLNCLVYKYEADLADFLDTHFNSRFEFEVTCGERDANFKNFLSWFESVKVSGIEGMIGGSSTWNSQWAEGIIIYEHSGTIPATFTDSIKSIRYHHEKSANKFTVSLSSSLFKNLTIRTRTLIEKYLYSPGTGLYFDYDCKNNSQSTYETATAIWPLWAGVIDSTVDSGKVKKLVDSFLSVFEVAGGIVSTTEKSRGKVGDIDRPARQWDYPYGWVPHQMIAWKSLQNYGFEKDAQRIAYRWLYLCLKSFVEFNGVVPEKFDVVAMTHRVDVEYGNVGSTFKYVVKEGWRGLLDPIAKAVFEFVD
ncbi:alpha,alpha-trehalase nth1 [Physocladia obscura]|uniref:Trehalase n=1 Tax=Physocladia obscura TaxID=109957 RepID=A0AAD5SZD7_9FUNG|nr:alpha,alpha-trehalase nth1 [Physocladia obscura]